MRELKRLTLIRIVAEGGCLDGLMVPAGVISLRTAHDELLLVPKDSGSANLAGLKDLPSFSLDDISDPHAIIVTDTGHSGVWLPRDEALAFIAHSCEWALPAHRPAFTQGSVAGIATKLWLEEERVLFIVPAPFAHDFAANIQ